MLTYTRNVQADYARYIGGPLPTKVVKVWLVVRSIGPAKGMKTRYL